MRHNEIDSISIPLCAYFCAISRKEPEVECISSSCSSTSESDDVPNPLSAAERAKLKVGLSMLWGWRLQFPKFAMK